MLINSWFCFKKKKTNFSNIFSERYHRLGKSTKLADQNRRSKSIWIGVKFNKKKRFIIEYLRERSSVLFGSLKYIISSNLF